MKCPRYLFAATIVVIGAIAGTGATGEQPMDERAEIKTVVEASIGWALEKDWDLLYGSLAQDAEFFIFHPDNASTIVGFEAFKTHVERLFKTDRFKATHFEVKDFRLTISNSGDVAWYACLLDDFYEWDGQPGGWENCRWTGVLEKRDSVWVICQMHFSFGTDRKDDAEEEQDASESQNEG